jgi:hypothetical protein
MRVIRLVDEADWKSLWPIVENIFFATSSIQIFADEQARIHSKRGGLIATSITTSIVFLLPVPTMVG